MAYGANSNSLGKLFGIENSFVVPLRWIKHLDICFVHLRQLQILVCPFVIEGELTGEEVKHNRVWVEDAVHGCFNGVENIVPNGFLGPIVRRLAVRLKNKLLVPFNPSGGILMLVNAS